MRDNGGGLSLGGKNKIGQVKFELPITCASGDFKKPSGFTNLDLVGGGGHEM